MGGRNKKEQRRECIYIHCGEQIGFERCTCGNEGGGTIKADGASSKGGI